MATIQNLAKNARKKHIEAQGAWERATIAKIIDDADKYANAVIYDRDKAETAYKMTIEAIVLEECVLQQLEKDSKQRIIYKDMHNEDKTRVSIYEEIIRYIKHLK